VAIHKVEGYGNKPAFVISSHQVWMPGNYDTEATARYAFQFSDEVLHRLMVGINQKAQRPITLEDLRGAKATRSKKP
jgi:hypothetical protein